MSSFLVAISLHTNFDSLKNTWKSEVVVEKQTNTEVSKQGAVLIVCYYSIAVCRLLSGCLSANRAISHLEYRRHVVQVNNPSGATGVPIYVYPSLGVLDCFTQTNNNSGYNILIYYKANLYCMVSQNL
jgi:hypothetical protein